MGARGPVPNRSDDLARPRSRKGGEHLHEEVTKGVALPVTIPEPDADWHPIATMMWEALSRSGQAAYYQQSDWAFAYSLCEDLSLYKEPRTTKDGEIYHKRSPEMLKALMTGMSSLLMTEADRRRVRIELEAPQPEETPASLVVLDDYKAGLGLEDSEETE